MTPQALPQVDPGGVSAAEPQVDEDEATLPEEEEGHPTGEGGGPPTDEGGGEDTEVPRLRRRNLIDYKKFY